MKRVGSFVSQLFFSPTNLLSLCVADAARFFSTSCVVQNESVCENDAIMMLRVPEIVVFAALETWRETTDNDKRCFVQGFGRAMMPKAVGAR